MSKKSVRFVLAAALIGCLFVASPVLYGQKLDETTLKSLTYRKIGPTRQSGRFVDFAWTPKEPKTFYAATASGHLWKSLDNGFTWSPLFTNEKVFSIGDVAVAPSDPKIVWVGTGEANNSRSSYWGNGMYKTTDAGKTWIKLGGGLPDGMLGRIGLDIFLRNPDIVYACIENANKKDMSDEERYQELLADKSSRGMIIYKNFLFSHATKSSTLCTIFAC